MSEKVKPSASLTASGQVGQENAVYHGYTVTVVTATAAINIRKGSLTGQIVDVIPAATAAGATKTLNKGLAMDAGLFVDFNGASGTVVVHFE
jgi:hypothetical protein